MTLTMLLALTLIPAARAAAQWKREHTVLAITSTAAITADWLMAANAARVGTFDEMNPILGTRPSVGQLNTYNLAILGGNLAIGYLLPSKLRTIWFTAVTSFEAAIVLHQYNIGLHIDFGQM
jgi:hypothetical protein